MKALNIGLASALVLATASPAALAQSYQPTEQYRRDMDRYQSQRAAYDADSAEYRAARRAYDRRRADWESARARYDARYGYGSYARAYGQAPVWADARWRDYSAPDVNYYSRDAGYVAPAPIKCGNNSTVAGGLIGALAGAALGSNLAANGRGTEGAVLGAVVGGGLGAAVGRSNDKYKCDKYGPYVAYNQTIPYREDTRWRSDRYSEYSGSMRCRLAAAPIDRDARDYRYVRVCPDGQGRYRFTG